MISVKRNKFVYGLMLLAVVSGCKPTKKDAGKVKSVSAILQDGKDSRGFLCGPVEGEQSIQSVYQSLPPRLRDEFPLNLNEKDEAKKSFWLVEDPSKVCRDGNPLACWIAKPGDKKPHIVLKNDLQVISRYIIPMTTMAYMEFYIDGIIGAAADQIAIKPGLETSSAGDVRFIKLANDIRSARASLAKSVYDDLVALDEEREKKGLDKPGAIINKYSLKYTEIFRNTTQKTLWDHTGFQNFILAESMDSYYCNSTTADEFNLNFKVRQRGTNMAFVDFFGAPYYAEQVQREHLTSTAPSQKK